MCCFLLLGWLGFLGFDLCRSTLVLLKARTSSLGTLTSYKEGWTTEVDVAGTNLGGWTTQVEPLSTNPPWIPRIKCQNEAIKPVNNATLNAIKVLKVFSFFLSFFFFVKQEEITM